MDRTPPRAGGVGGRGTRSTPSDTHTPLVGASEASVSRSGVSKIPNTSRTVKADAGKCEKPPRVMVADDDHAVLDRISEILKRHGMDVCPVDNPYEIGALIGTFKPHVLVLDEYFGMSGIDFRKIMSSVVRRYPMLKVVVTTGGSTRQSGADAGDPSVWGAMEVRTGGGVPEDDVLLQAVRHGVS